MPYYSRRQIKNDLQDRMIFGDFPVNFEPFSLKFCKGHFLLKLHEVESNINRLFE